MSNIEEMSVSMLEELSPFTVLWEQTTTVGKVAKNGGTYEKKKIIIKNARYNVLFGIEIPAKIYERLRLLKLSGINTYSATNGTADTRGFRPVIVTGAPLYKSEPQPNEVGGVFD